MIIVPILSAQPATYLVIYHAFFIFQRFTIAMIFCPPRNYNLDSNYFFHTLAISLIYLKLPNQGLRWEYYISLVSSNLSNKTLKKRKTR